MINLLMALGLLIILLIINRVFYRYPSWPKFGLMLLISLVAGVLMDYVLGYKVGWWYYVHHKWFTPDYFWNLYPAWTMVLTIFILFYSILDKAIENQNIRITIYFVVVCAQQEFMGTWRHSWEYNAPLPLILVGWILLLECCILIKWLLDKKYKEVKPLKSVYYPDSLT